MSKPSHIQEIKTKPDPHLVSLIEDVLKSAKEGKLVNIVFVGESVGGNILTGQSIDRDRSNIYAVIGALEVLKTLMTGFIEL